MVGRTKDQWVDPALVRAVYAAGYSMREVAEDVGISLERVRQILRRDRPDLIRPKCVGMGMSPRERLTLK